MGKWIHSRRDLYKELEELVQEMPIDTSFMIELQKKFDKFQQKIIERKK